MNTIEEALADLQAGKAIIVVDSAHRENEGDLIIAAEKATPELINFMIRHGSGIVCVSITKERAEKLQLPPMVKDNTDRLQTPFTISVDAKECRTGVSAADRYQTVQAILGSDPNRLTRPGHMFPLVAQEQGVLARPGLTEASIDLMRLAGLQQIAVMCELMNGDGTMARLSELTELANKNDFKIISIEDLIALRRKE